MSDIQTKAVNIVLLFDDSILDITQSKIGDIRDKIIEFWGKSPIITQLPDLIGIIEPETQFSCVIQKNHKVIISDQNISTFASRTLDNIFKFVHSYVGIIPRRIKAYGFNYNFRIDFPSNAEQLLAIQKKNKELINIKSLGLNDIAGCGINFRFDHNSDKMLVSSVPIYNDEFTEMIGLEIKANIHFPIEDIPAFADLKRLFSEKHDLVVEKINIFFNI